MVRGVSVDVVEAFKPHASSTPANLGETMSVALRPVPNPDQSPDRRPRTMPTPPAVPGADDDRPSVVDGAAPGAAAAAGDITIRVVGWPDPVIDRLGYDPRSLYVETFWLGILGPTSTWLIRRFAAGLDDAPAGFDLDLEDTARAMGLGGRSGRHSPFRRALARCVTFQVARQIGPTTLAVRRKIPPLPRRHLQRLPASLQDQHEQWMTATRRSPLLEEVRRHSRRLALGLVESGESAPAVERQLLRWKVHPALAHEATQWAMARRAEHPPAAP